MRYGLRKVGEKVSAGQKLSIEQMAELARMSMSANCPCVKTLPVGISD
jgi:hypothetical protein